MDQKTKTNENSIIRCKAAICRIPGEAVVIEEIEVDPPKAWEVRIKILCTTLCHTDLGFWNLKQAPASLFPRILGHEAVGKVESVGENVEEVREGDLVVPVFQPNCEECRDCMSKKSNGCSVFGGKLREDMPRDESNRFRDSKGKVIHHFLGVSSFSEYTVVDVTQVVKVTLDIPVDKACLLGCGVSTGIGAAWNVANVEKGSTVSIFGLGTVGLAVAEGAKLRGASKIIGVDLNPDKFDLGKKFGVTDFVNPAAIAGGKSVSEVIKDLTDGGSDYCFECIGLASLMQDALSSCRENWGRTVILGVEMKGTPMNVNSLDILRGKTLTGSLFGGVKPKTDIPIFAAKYLNNELNLDDFITHEVSFEDINKAFDLLIEGKSLRCIIWMNDC